MKHMLAITQLSCKRQGRPLFSDLSFCVNAGEVLLVEGANGAGKSSLLRLLAGLATPASGDVLWQNRSIYSYLREYQQQLNYIGHTNGLRLDLTIEENLRTTEKTALSAFNLTNYIHLPARMLSAGQKRKVALTKLLLSKKQLWLLDEPLTALDVEAQAIFFRLLRHHLEQGGMAVVSSHQPITLDVNMKSINL